MRCVAPFTNTPRAEAESIRLSEMLTPLPLLPTTMPFATERIRFPDTFAPVDRTKMPLLEALRTWFPETSARSTSSLHEIPTAPPSMRLPTTETELIGLPPEEPKTRMPVPESEFVI